jgi:hypothetical protein
MVMIFRHAGDDALAVSRALARSAKVLLIFMQISRNPVAVSDHVSPDQAIP